MGNFCCHYEFPLSSALNNYHIFGTPTHFDIIINSDACDTNKVDHNTSGGVGNPAGQRIPSLCQNSTYTYLATPNIAGFTYTWCVTGGVLSWTTGNPITITWGNGTTGSIILVVTSNTDPTCVKTIKKDVSLRPGPKAGSSRREKAALMYG